MTDEWFLYYYNATLTYIWNIQRFVRRERKHRNGSLRFIHLVSDMKSDSNGNGFWHLRKFGQRVKQWKAYLPQFLSLTVGNQTKKLAVKAIFSILKEVEKSRKAKWYPTIKWFRIPQTNLFISIHHTSFELDTSSKYKNKCKNKQVKTFCQVLNSLSFLSVIRWCLTTIPSLVSPSKFAKQTSKLTKWRWQICFLYDILIQYFRIKYPGSEWNEWNVYDRWPVRSHFPYSDQFVHEKNWNRCEIIGNFSVEVAEKYHFPWLGIQCKKFLSR